MIGIVVSILLIAGLVARAESVARSVCSNGAREVRLEFFDGGHIMHQPHERAALEWFAAKD